MPRWEDTLASLLQGNSDRNIDFDALRNLLRALGFEERIRGDHHIFVRRGVVEIINIQPVGAKAMAYQVRQIRSIVLKYRLGEGK